MAHAKKEKADEKKYVQMAPETVQLLAETVGLGHLSPTIATSLSEDATYRTRELAHICSQFMRHSKRTRLTAEDVSRALKWFDEAHLVGHGVPGSGTAALGGGGGGQQQRGGAAPGIGGMRYCEEADVFAVEEAKVDLMQLVTEDDGEEEEKKVDVDGQHDIEVSWLSIEGTLVQEEENFAVEFPHFSSLSQALAQYYNATVQSIVNDSEEVCAAVYAEISSNPKISRLVPFYVNFLRTGIQRHGGSQKRLLKRLLLFLRSLFSNPYLNFSPKPYLSHLVTALLSSLIPDRPGREVAGGGLGQQQQQNGVDGGAQNSSYASSSVTHRQLEAAVEHARLASAILRDVLERWATPINQLRCQTYRALTDCLKDPSLSHPASHLGALVALGALGPAVVAENLLPIFRAYAKALEAKIEALESRKSSKGVEETKMVYYQLRGALLLAVSSVVYSYSVSRRSSRKRRRAEEAPLAAAHRDMAELLGDALCAAPPPPVLGRRPPLVIPEKETVGKMRVRRLLLPGGRQGPAATNGMSAANPAAPNKTPPRHRTPPPQAARRKSRSRSSFDSTTNFDSLAHQGVPNDIFDVDPMDTSLSPDRHQRTRGSSSSVFLHRSRPDLITPRKISPSAASVFEVAASSSPATTASRYREIKISHGNPLPREQLRRKRFLAPVSRYISPAAPAPSSESGGDAGRILYVGRRMDYPWTTERFRKLKLLSCSLCGSL